MSLDGAQASDVLAYACQNAVEPFLEPVLDLCSSLAALDAPRARARSPANGASAPGGSRRAQPPADAPLLTEPLIAQLPLLLDLSLHPEPFVSTAAAECLALMVRASAAGCDVVWCGVTVTPAPAPARAA